MGFPENFIWGAASASYQVEGAAFEDGRGLSIWDHFTRQPDAIFNGDSGDISGNHYHHYQEDVGLMRDIGLQAYRFSVAWSRVIPNGVGPTNPAGLDFYDRLIDALLEAKIKPYVTLYHWDLPLELQFKGGWLNRDCADWFGEYADLIVRTYGDRVSQWITLNEPSIVSMLGYLKGEHAPGWRIDTPAVMRTMHHLLMGHGKATSAIRAFGGDAMQISLASTGPVQCPVSDTPHDIEAARQATFYYKPDLFAHQLWLDPLFGDYDPQIVAGLEATHALQAGDMAIIQQPIDVIGLNIYHGGLAQATPAGGFEEVKHELGHPVTLMHWPVKPASLYWGPRFIHERYNLPIMITENGLSNPDWVALDGQVHDPQRIDYTQRYLREYQRAGEDGVDIRAYFHWTIMDNFEWAEGMKHRFGLIHIDYATGKRTLKDSAYWYRDVIQANGANL